MKPYNTGMKPYRQPPTPLSLPLPPSSSLPPSFFPSSSQQPQSLPSDSNHGNTTQPSAKGVRGKKTRVTWGGMPAQKQRKKPKRSTELGPPKPKEPPSPPQTRESPYPDPLMAYNLCEEGCVSTWPYGSVCVHCSQ